MENSDKWKDKHLQAINDILHDIIITSSATDKNVYLMSSDNSAVTPIASSVYHIPDWVYRTIILLEICIFLIGLIGNVMACLVIACSKSMYTTINLYLLNLSVSDALYLITSTPDDVYQYYNNEKFYVDSSTVCFLRNWFGETSVNVSILTITALTVERYLAICHPFFSRAMSQKSRVRKIIIFIWLFSSFCASILVEPSTIIRKPKTSLYVCDIKPLPYSIEVMTILFFVLPMAIISILYGLIIKELITRKQMVCQIDRHTRKTVKMLVVIIIAFFSCWAPFQAQRLMAVYFPGMKVDIGITKICFVIYQYFSIITGVTCVLSAAVNPIIYTFMSENFRKAFKDLLSKSNVTNSNSRSSDATQSQNIRSICHDIKHTKSTRFSSINYKKT